MALKNLPKTIIQEMLGRVSDEIIRSRKLYLSRAFYNMPSVDLSRTNYDLTRALYYATTVLGQDGNYVGEDYLLGAGFARPIIDIGASFSFALNPVISINDVANPVDTNQQINQWFSKNESKFYSTMKWMLRDGDHYLITNGDGSLFSVHGRYMEKIVDELTGEVIGYDRKIQVKEANKTTQTEYRVKYRLNEPVVIVKIEDGKETEMPELTDRLKASYPENVKGLLLPVNEFQNDIESNLAYGFTDFQGVIYYMANYHAVLQNSIKNNIFNSNSVPTLKGVEDKDKFMADNGVKQSDGEYTLRWSSNEALIGGDNFGLDFVTGDDTTQGAERLLNILFWNICQNSRTPEFLFGTAVQSSKASVEEQVPAIIKKALEKQKQQKDYIKQAVRTHLDYNRKDYPSLPTDIRELDVDVVFPPIVTEDKKLQLDLVRFMSEQGIIQDQTKLELLDVEIENIPDEIELAREELKKKNEMFQVPETY